MRRFQNAIEFCIVDLRIDRTGCSVVRRWLDLLSIPLQCDAHQLTSCPDASLCRDQVPAYAPCCRTRQDKIESRLLVG
jgi:hypothetical protein